jgi:replicative DNA helicase
VSVTKVVGPSPPWQGATDDAAFARSGDVGRTPPQDHTAEQSVLGAMLLSKDAIADVVESVRGADFYRPAHETVFEAVLDLYGRGEPADAVTVAAELQRRGELARAGGAPYLHTLVAGVPIAANAGYYAQIVREKSILRRLVDAGTRIAQMGYAEQGDVDDVVDAAQTEVYNVSERRTSEDYLPLAEVLPATIDEMEAIESRDGRSGGVPTGFADLDELTNGLHPGQMVVVAARPGAGKSTLGLDLCRSASIKHGLSSAIFSLEMNRVEISMRLLSAEARVSLQEMRTGKLSETSWQRHDLKLIVIDYLQLMTSGKRVESRQVEVSEFSRQIKLLAKEIEVPIVAISQLNRGPEQRNEKKPMLSDLRESGAIEQDADMVILIHRPDMYEREHERAGEADLIVAKHRAGPIRDVTVSFQGHYSCFADMAHGY